MPSKRKSKSPGKRSHGPPAAEGMDFAALVGAIRQAHGHCAAQAARAVNVSLTLRNWAIGGYIHQYELHGQDRANYGDGLLDALAGRLTELKVSNCNRRQLYRYLRFFRLYPGIVGTLSPQLQLLPGLADGALALASAADPEKVWTFDARMIRFTSAIAPREV